MAMVAPDEANGIIIWEGSSGAYVDAAVKCGP